MNAKEANKLVTEYNNSTWPLNEIYDLIASTASSGGRTVNYYLGNADNKSLKSAVEILREDGYEVEYREGFNYDDNFWETIDISW